MIKPPNAVSPFKAHRSRVLQRFSFAAMKNSLCTLAALGLLVLSPGVQAQVTSAIWGHLTLNLQQGTNFIGFALVPTMELQAKFDISGTDRKIVFLNGGPGFALTHNQFNIGSQTSHAIEVITSGAGQGFMSPITATLATNNQLTLAQEIPAGVANGASLKVWKLWTLADLFGATNTAGLTGGTTPATADLVLLPNGSGFNQFFYSTGGAQGTGWRQVGGGTTNRATTPIFMSSGLSIRARTAKPIVILGQVKPGHTQVTLQTGMNYVANLCPVNTAGDNPSTLGRTLANSGLADGLTGASSSQAADLVMLWNGTGYDQYFNSTGGPLGTGWRKVGDSAKTNQAQVPLPDGAYIILRRGAPVTITLNQGSF